MTRGAAVTVVWSLAMAAAGLAQEHHLSPVSGLPHGIPRLCAAPTATATGDGAWSNASTWSGGRVPSAGDSVLVAAGVTVTYDAVSDSAIACVDVAGVLRFQTW